MQLWATYRANIILRTKKWTNKQKSWYDAKKKSGCGYGHKMKKMCGCMCGQFGAGAGGGDTLVWPYCFMTLLLYDLTIACLCHFTTKTNLPSSIWEVNMLLQYPLLNKFIYFYIDLSTVLKYFQPQRGLLFLLLSDLLNFGPLKVGKWSAWLES